ncbi:MAG: TonB-dependent receptor, partial [Acidobacteria bacterium]|nr:TonB-dependent receptor [Acidobacteriota bacterium]
QDSNDPSVSGSQQPINNPDVVQELRLLTNQFAAEYGRAAGSVVNVVTKSGTNSIHGSAFWFNNNEVFNARSNLDKAFGFKDAPRRNENQFGGTVGGPIIKDKTFFFGSYQRWTDRQLGSGATINGAPTETGRQILQQLVGSRPQVAALLKFLPVAQTPNGSIARFSPVVGDNCNPTAPGAQPDPGCIAVPLGSLTGANSIAFNNHQWSGRADHRFSEKHQINGRYFINDQSSVGDGQATPLGLGNVQPSRNQSANIGLTSVLSGSLVNEVRIAYQRFGSTTNAQSPSSQEIPSIEINQLGLIGFNAAATRTAIGLAVNLPQFRFNNTYQIIDNLSWTKGSHAMKFGFDFRRVQVKSFFFPTIRGRLAYQNLETFVDDIAITSAINKPVAGGSEIQYYNWYDYFFYAQDEWKITPNFALTYGLRYETPGNSIGSLESINEKILAANGNNPVLRFRNPGRDTNNFQPRVGFNWRPNFGSDGIAGRLLGGDKTVIRGGYSRTNDYGFININLNIASAFPFVFALNPSLTNAYANLLNASAPPQGNWSFITQTTVGEDFRAPAADQFSFEISRELAKDWVMRVGYVGTKGNALFQTVDGNPVVQGRTDRTSPAFLYNPPGTTLTNQPLRVDPTRGVERLRCNCAQSIYHSMQVSLDKRLSQNFSAGVHYTWSTFIDTASEIFNPQPQGEVATPQDPFNRNADRARSSYDRPHRLTGNFIYEFPVFRDQAGLAGHILGGWQANAFFTLQSGTPFTVLNGADPAGTLQGIDGLVGNAIRPNLNSTLDLSSMNIIELRAAGGASLFRALQPGQRTGNVGRNTLRGDGIANLDFGLFKNTKILEGHNIQFRAEFFNATNTRNFGTPNTFINSNVAFLNQWAFNGGNRRILMGLRYTF